MSQKIVGTVLAAGGVIMILVSVTADFTGLGFYPSFGWKQMLGTGIGIADIVAGLLIRQRGQ